MIFYRAMSKAEYNLTTSSSLAFLRRSGVKVEINKRGEVK